MTDISLDHHQKSYQRYDFNDKSTFYIISYMIEYYNIIYKYKKVNQLIVIVFK